mmetsp:Transcript_6680/g.21539  ORF Transcript_6680/g.21539 Transcript_6680/m.21539 type:complete len:257 (-) Transcript_6680:26-796(-)
MRFLWALLVAVVAECLSPPLDRRFFLAVALPGAALAKECDDSRPEECMYRESRSFEFGRRTLRLRQAFGQSGTTGNAVWEGSEVLAAYLDANPELVSGKRVLEIGTGCGLGAMVAKLEGASFVRATDGDDDVVALARRNLDDNQFRDVATSVLRWEDAVYDDPEESYDVVLGADVTYFPKGGSAGPLVNAILASGASTALLAYKRRTPRDDDTVAQIAKAFGPATLLLEEGGKVRVLRFDRRDPSSAPDEGPPPGG